MKESDVYINTEITYRTAEHETLLSFRGDLDNELFQEWWCKTGLKEFIKWNNKVSKERFV